MELLLIEDVSGLGTRGEIVDVARGYARNYLLPRKLAQVPTPQLVEETRRKAEVHAAQRAAEKADRMEVAKEIAGVTLTITAKASEEGHLYGSVGGRQIAESLGERGFSVEEKQVHLDTPIKEIGEYDVPIALHPEVTVPVKVTVAAEPE